MGQQCAAIISVTLAYFFLARVTSTVTDTHRASLKTASSTRLGVEMASVIYESQSFLYCFTQHEYTFQKKIKFYKLNTLVTCFRYLIAPRGRCMLCGVFLSPHPLSTPRAYRSHAGK